MTRKRKPIDKSLQQPSIRRNLPDERSTGVAETVEEYTARGGQIQYCPGFQNNGVYPRRRPTGPQGYRSIT